MKILMQFCLIFIVCIVGDIISALLPFTFPGSIIAMLILFALFIFHLIPLEKLEPTGSWLQRNMAFFFLPSNILIMKEFDLIANIWLKLLFICFVSAFAAGVATLVIKIQEKITKNHNSPSLEEEGEKSLRGDSNGNAN